MPAYLELPLTEFIEVELLFLQKWTMYGYAMKISVSNGSSFDS